MPTTMMTLFAVSRSAVAFTVSVPQTLGVRLTDFLSF
jgi:hypothetical protein